MIRVSTLEKTAREPTNTWRRTRAKLVWGGSALGSNETVRTASMGFPQNQVRIRGRFTRPRLPQVTSCQQRSSPPALALQVEAKRKVLRRCRNGIILQVIMPLLKPRGCPLATQPDQCMHHPETQPDRVWSRSVTSPGLTGLTVQFSPTPRAARGAGRHAEAASQRPGGVKPGCSFMPGGDEGQKREPTPEKVDHEDLQVGADPFRFDRWQVPKSALRMMSVKS